MQITEKVIELEPLAVRRGTAAKMLDCSPTTIHKLMKAGKLRTVKVGADDRILIDSIRALVASA
ncbi:MAG: hypothetical protein A3G81_26125 [Betaproteobacteria bacterium RIFCSPLOWO2_12_FULL_65_14]|nr:MAG: hypothetical protein A3G81_26125 [Betaproteobacteria bacterium RIFCSPLOWO2_12_FULL_65_14]